MGRLKLPISYQPYAGNMRAATSPMQSSQSMKEVIPVDHSDTGSTTQSRRATVSLDPEVHQDIQVQTRETMHVCSRPPSTPPGVYTPMVQSPTRSISTLLRGRALQHAIQDRYPPILECLKAHLGNAQASQLYKQDTTSDSPISTAVRQIQECGRPARAEALQTVGMLLKRIDQHKLGKEEVRNVFFMKCIDMFARVSIINLTNPSSDSQLCIQNPLDNIAEVSLEFQRFNVLVQEEILQGSDFIRAAITLCEEGHYDGCKLFVKLALDDSKTKLAEDEITILTIIISNLQDKGKQKAA
ncbi:hypothetical protein ACEPAF_9206 [Sanghuangporus sanghuang]